MLFPVIESCVTHCLENVYLHVPPLLSVISVSEIIERVVEGRWPYLRPLLCPQSHSDEIGQLMQRCWSEDVNERPDFSQIKVLLRKNNRYLKHKSSHEQVT